MSDDIAEALARAEEAHRIATQALRFAEAAAREAGVPVPDRDHHQVLRDHHQVLRTERIDVVEPDGTLRMTISSNARFPGIMLRGTEHEHPSRKTLAGILFFNDDATENGGLVYHGHAEDGAREGVVHLSFDNVEQDQVIALTAADSGPQEQSVRLEFNDQPRWSQVDLMDTVGDLEGDERQRATIAFAEEHGWATSRMRLAREPDGSVGLALKDAAGRTRLLLRVDPDGTPRVETLDEEGAVAASLPPSAAAGRNR